MTDRRWYWSGHAHGLCAPGARAGGFIDRMDLLLLTKEEQNQSKLPPGRQESELCRH
jgi:hypothetical protein